MLARLIDMVVQFVLLIVILILAGIAAASGKLNTASVAAVYITGLVLVIVGYPVIFETLSRGRTLGKLALGLRVVADDGGPVRFRHALVRALAGAVECWGLFGIPALVTSMLSARGKRLGDIFAGTFVIRVRAPRTPASPLAAGSWAAGPYPGGAYPGSPYLANASRVAGVPIDPRLGPWASALELSALPDGLAASADSYLSRIRQLDPAARDRIGMQLAADIAARVSPPPPPGVPPAVFLYTVLAERRNRELSRMWAAQYAAAQQQAAQPVVQPGTSFVPPPAAQPPFAQPSPAQPPVPQAPAAQPPVGPPAAGPSPAQPPAAQPEPSAPADADGFIPPA
jgi:uncharacterized RDD family membrane protein YckC